MEKDDPEDLHTGTEYRHEFRPNDAEQLKAVHREMIAPKVDIYSNEGSTGPVARKRNDSHRMVSQNTVRISYCGGQISGKSWTRC